MSRGRKLLIAAMFIGFVAMTITVGASRADVPFAPTISLETSTTRATAHPDARIIINNTASDANIKDLNLSLPDGFWGSLGAVPTKCPAADGEAGTCGTTTPESKIGTVTATALIEDGDTTANGVLTGDIFLTGDLTGDSTVANDNDPAGVSILVHAKVGEVDLGDVKIQGRAVARTFTPVGFPLGAKPELKGLDTIVKDIPEEITDTAHVPNRTVAYKVEKMQIDLKSELRAPNDPEYLPPLLTNPSRCDTYSISATATPYGGGADETFSDDYIVDQCDTARFDPTSTTTFANLDVDGKIPWGEPQAVYSSLAFPAATNQPDSNSSLDSMTIYLPRSMGANYAAFGNNSGPDPQLCFGSATGVVGGHRYFDPSSCPGPSLIGLAYIYTPLLPPGQPLIADIYSINTSPVPSIALAAVGGNYGNPMGIDVYLVGAANNYKTDSSCVSGCDMRIGITFSNLPDTPITNLDVVLDPGDNRAGTTLSGRFLDQADDGADNCQENNDVVSVMQGSSGGSRASVDTTETTCTGNTIHPTTGPWGQVTTDSTPTFDFTYSGAAANLWCGIDSIIGVVSDCKAAGAFTAPSTADGAHRMIIGDNTTSASFGSKSLVRDFVVQPTLSYDEVVPTTSLSAGPGAPGPAVGTTDDSTPSFTFSSSETGTFQCSLDDGAFLPCGSATGTADASYSIPVAEYLEASDTVHTFEVRAQDTAGNVDLSPAKASFKVEKLFDPQNSVVLSTNVARAHPELTMTITNDSHEDIKDLHLNLPDGFFGGLTGVVARCPIASADAGTCDPGSQIGTVDATAVIDRSTASIKGKVYLTMPRNDADPAGLTIEVKPKLQGVTFNPIRINATLEVRGQADGINTAALTIPRTTTTTIGEVSEFDVRTMVIKLQNNNAAPQPLLTNPSACFTGAFATTFDGYDSSQTTDNPTVSFVGCQNLGFGPVLGLSQVERSTGAPPGPSTAAKRATVDFTAALTSDPNGAGIKSVDLTLPGPLTIDAQLIPPPCFPSTTSKLTECPANTAVGTVSAVSPLLPEPIEGKVYVLKSPTSLPRLLVSLRGIIDVDLVAVNRNTGPGFSQIATSFSTLPDVPLTSFNMKINGFLTTRDNTCRFGPEEWNVLGTMNGHNGSASAVNVPLKFDCPNATNSVFAQSWKPKNSKSTLGLQVGPAGSRTLKKTTITLPKGVKFIKSALTKKKIAKKITVIAGGKKLKASCFKVKSSTTFEIGFCKKSATDVFVTFKSGSLTTKSKSKKVRAKVKTVDSAKKAQYAKFVTELPF